MSRRVHLFTERPQWASQQDGQNAVLRGCVRLMEELHLSKAGTCAYPDQTNRASKDVDLTVSVGDRSFAFEHTRIEQFPEALRTKRFVEVDDRARFVRLHDELVANLPRGTYEVQLETPQGDRRKLDRLFADVELWIKQELGTFDGHFMYRGHPKLDRTNQRPFLTVRAYPPETDDGTTVNITLVSGDDEIAGREAVIARAFEAKAPKLEPYKARGYTTVLVLDDMAFSPLPVVPIVSASALLEQPVYTAAIDYVVQVSAEVGVWTLQYARAGTRLGKRDVCQNWWLYDPTHSFIMRYDARGRGCRGQLWDALERHGLASPQTSHRPHASQK